MSASQRLKASNRTKLVFALSTVGLIVTVVWGLWIFYWENWIFPSHHLLRTETLDSILLALSIASMIGSLFSLIADNRSSRRGPWQKL